MSPARAKKWIDKYLKYLVGMLFSALLFLITMSGTLDPVFHEEHILSAPSHRYLTQELKRDEDFLVVAVALDTVLTLIQSSSAGVSFIVDADIKIGEIIGGLARTARKMMAVASLSVIGILSLGLMLTVAGYIGKATVLLLSASVAILMLLRIVPRVPVVVLNVTTRVARVAGVLFLAAHLIIPGAIFLSSTLSSELTGKMKTEARSSYSKLHDEISAGHHASGLKDRVKSTVGALAEHNAKGHHRVEIALRHFSRYLVAVVFDLLILPFGFLLMLTLICRSAFRSTGSLGQGAEKCR